MPHLILPRVLYGEDSKKPILLLLFLEEESEAQKLTKVTPPEGFCVSTKKSPKSDLR